MALWKQTDFQKFGFFLYLIESQIDTITLFRKPPIGSAYEIVGKISPDI
ncbi:hypothetical protein PAMC26510_06110 [Caballeronia sordidicola]|uniref:Uncharacterized protein n=1 Tax=Caballeronia sordidicola TaxID=196367 RepID=A0A242N670_CABSO|nr:hypothetical protein PAMC26510_06110 [Caballeronia sordidicola]